MSTLYLIFGTTLGMILSSSCATATHDDLSANRAPNATPYPAHWWTPVPSEGAPAWEILPQEAKPGEVILSKRNELGILSNFAPTPFIYRGKKYASLEGFWQMMHYPEGPNDPRSKLQGWKHTREEVAQMTAFDAKKAGSEALAITRKAGIDWVSFEGDRFPYYTQTPGTHYTLILEAMKEKLNQNPRVKEILLMTGDLILRADHHQDPNDPPEWRYNQIWMNYRTELQTQNSPLLTTEK